MRPLTFPAPWKASGSMAVETMAIIAPPVRPSMEEVATVRTLDSLESGGMLSGRMSEPSKASSPVEMKTVVHMKTILALGTPCCLSRLAALKASGKLAIKTDTSNTHVKEPSLVMKPSISASGMPSSVTPSHMDMATCLALPVPGGIRASMCPEKERGSVDPPTSDMPSLHVLDACRSRAPACWPSVVPSSAAAWLSPASPALPLSTEPPGLPCGPERREATRISSRTAAAPERLLPCASTAASSGTRPLPSAARPSSVARASPEGCGVADPDGGCCSSHLFSAR
mmetsp:Transcript_90636/g.275152  ORF Transcript_90636/g.275152 Transcript_90636/m.275152 type:complete len:285 (-) Transcript_90636:391-1245(-)